MNIAIATVIVTYLSIIIATGFAVIITSSHVWRRSGNLNRRRNSKAAQRRAGLIGCLRMQNLRRLLKEADVAVYGESSPITRMFCPAKAAASYWPSIGAIMLRSGGEEALIHEAVHALREAQGFLKEEDEHLEEVIAEAVALWWITPWVDTAELVARAERWYQRRSYEDRKPLDISKASQCASEMIERICTLS